MKDERCSKRNKAGSEQRGSPGHVKPSPDAVVEIQNVAMNEERKQRVQIFAQRKGGKEPLRYFRTGSLLQSHSHKHTTCARARQHEHEHTRRKGNTYT